MYFDVRLYRIDEITSGAALGEQAWAARYRQGRRLAGGCEGSPLRECAEHVKNSARRQAAGCRLAAPALLALCSAGLYRDKLRVHFFCTLFFVKGCYNY